MPDSWEYARPLPWPAACRPAAAVPRATKPCQEPRHAVDGQCAKTVGVTASVLPSFAARDTYGLSRAWENGTCARFLAPTWHLCQEAGTAGQPEEAGTGAVNRCDQARQQHITDGRDRVRTSASPGSRCQSARHTDARFRARKLAPEHGSGDIFLGTGHLPSDRPAATSGDRGHGRCPVAVFGPGFAVPEDGDPLRGFLSG